MTLQKSEDSWCVCCYSKPIFTFIAVKSLSVERPIIMDVIWEERSKNTPAITDIGDAKENEWMSLRK